MNELSIEYLKYIEGLKYDAYEGNIYLIFSWALKTDPSCSCLRPALQTIFLSKESSIFCDNTVLAFSLNSQVELSAVELESLRSELTDLEEREAHLKAQYEMLVLSSYIQFSTD